MHSFDCSFQYEVGAEPYLVKSKVGDTVSNVPGQINFPRPTVTLSTLRRWVQQHPNGAVEMIDFDPAHPDRISLVGVDRDLKWQTTSGHVHGAVVFAALAAGLLLIGVWLKQSGSPTGDARQASSRAAEAAPLVRAAARVLWSRTGVGQLRRSRTCRRDVGHSRADRLPSH